MGDSNFFYNSSHGYQKILRTWLGVGYPSVADTIKVSLQDDINVYRINTQLINQFAWKEQQFLIDVIGHPWDKVPTTVILWVGQNDADSMSTSSTRKREEAIQDFKIYIRYNMDKIKTWFAQNLPNATLTWMIPEDDENAAFIQTYNEMVKIIKEEYKKEIDYITIDKNGYAMVYAPDEYHLEPTSRTKVANAIVDWYRNRRTVKDLKNTAKVEI